MSLFTERRCHCERVDPFRCVRTIEGIVCKECGVLFDENTLGDNEFHVSTNPEGDGALKTTGRYQDIKPIETAERNCRNIMDNLGIDEKHVSRSTMLSVLRMEEGPYTKILKIGICLASVLVHKGAGSNVEGLLTPDFMSSYNIVHKNTNGGSFMTVSAIKKVVLSVKEFIRIKVPVRGVPNSEHVFTNLINDFFWKASGSPPHIRDPVGRREVVQDAKTFIFGKKKIVDGVEVTTPGNLEHMVNVDKKVVSNVVCCVYCIKYGLDPYRCVYSLVSKGHPFSSIKKIVSLHPEECKEAVGLILGYLKKFDVEKFVSESVKMCLNDADSSAKPSKIRSNLLDFLNKSKDSIDHFEVAVHMVDNGMKNSEANVLGAMKYLSNGDPKSVVDNGSMEDSETNVPGATESLSNGGSKRVDRKKAGVKRKRDY